MFRLQRFIFSLVILDALVIKSKPSPESSVRDLGADFKDTRKMSFVYMMILFSLGKETWSRRRF